MYEDETAHIVLLCYIHWLYDIDENEEYYLERKRADIEWHKDNYKEIYDLLCLCYAEYAFKGVISEDDNLIEDLRTILDDCSRCIADCEEIYQECEEDYNQHVSNMEMESETIDDICTYDYYTDILILEPRNVYTYF